MSNFKDFECWKAAKNIVKEIYMVTKYFPKSEDFNMKSQVQRAAVSIMSNLAEGHGRQTDKEKTQFTYIALGSLNEVHSLLLLALELEYTSDARLSEIEKLITELNLMCHSYIKYVSKK